MEGGRNGGTNRVVSNEVLINNSNLVQRNCCSLKIMDFVSCFKTRLSDSFNVRGNWFLPSNVQLCMDI